ncbi:MAG TPA: HPF/RaiA family ribosome-associated protein [Bryobacteraceae bacterium]|nr:HPF/RaiA family ribosome-associated protein [Bryobacteraceae bacterium]
MKITYTGRQEAFPSKQRAKLEANIQKLSKLIDRRGEREAHVILAQERFLNKVEITMNMWDHALVGIGADSDPVVAAHQALERLEKQILKMRNKFRDTKRHKDKSAAAPEGAVAAPMARRAKRAAAASNSSGKNRKKVFRVDNRDGKKPMTLEEAMLEMESSQDYMVYRDSKTDRVTVLMRRPDGHFDLIES